MKEKVFNKECTKVIKGIAILMLVAAHCLADESRIYGYEVDFGIFTQQIAMDILYSMYICVGVFVFLSSYGLTKSYLKNKDIKAGDFIKTRIVKLLGSFCFVSVLGIGITLLLTDINPYGGGFKFFCNLLSDVFGLGGILQTPRLIGGWWYISFAMLIIILVPLTEKIYEQYGGYVFFIYVLLLSLMRNQFSAIPLKHMMHWFLIIPFGVVFAKLDTFERIKTKIQENKIAKNNVLDRILKFAAMTSILIILGCVRETTWASKYIYYLMNLILSVYFVFYLYEFVVEIPIINKILSYLGKHSANIFYIHGLIRAIWFKDFTYSLGNALYIFLFVFGTSLVISIIIEFVKKITKYEKLIERLSLKVANKA